MKIRDIIQEKKDPKLTGSATVLPTNVTNPLPSGFIQKQLRNTDPYMQYRYGLAVASARALQNGDLKSTDFEQESAWAENLTQIGFVPEDDETVRLASELMGVDPTKITNSKSIETPDTNTASPVAKKKTNKYGV
jgi:hypothetical protein